MRDIGTTASDSSSGATINANNHIVGTSTINGFDNRQHAFLYDGAAIRNLGAIGNNDFLSDRSTGNGINIHDVVVGTTYRPYASGALYQIPFVYRDSGPINQRRAVLLTPTITPASLVSRKTHGTSGEYDINLPLTGNPGIECRAGGPGSSHTLVVSFNNSVVR